MTPDLLPLVISAIVGAGGFAGLATLYKAFIERKKVPADISLTSLGGAEKALLMMKSLLDEAQERMQQLKAEMTEERQRFQHERERYRGELEAKDREMQTLQTNMQILRDQFTSLARQLDRLQQEAQAVRDGNNDSTQ